MQRIVLLSLLLLLSASIVDAAKLQMNYIQDADSFLGGRQVLCSVDFAVNSTQLSTKAQAVLSQNITRLKQFDLDKKMIRIEGFSSPEGDKDKNFRLSIDRARAVESFLRVDHGVSLKCYITGYGSTMPENLIAAGTRRVEIVIYDNPWNQKDIPVELSGGK